MFSFFFFFFRQASSYLRDSFTMVFAQNSNIFHKAVHQPIAFFQVWSLTRRFEPLTEELSEGGEKREAEMGCSTS